MDKICHDVTVQQPQCHREWCSPTPGDIGRQAETSTAADLRSENMADTMWKWKGNGKCKGYFHESIGDTTRFSIMTEGALEELRSDNKGSLSQRLK